MHQSRTVVLWMICFAVVEIGGCNGNGSSTTSANESRARGTLIYNPPLRIAHLSAVDFESELNASADGQSLLTLTGTPQCGIDFHYIEYATVGAKGESTTATGALMVPNGSAAPCGGPRPIVLYAHGTTAEKSYNIADIVDTDNAGNAESALVAAMFAAQGYIVVAPNYAGYDASPLPYHPYLNADQQSKDMIDALTAARAALGGIPASGTTDDGRLFITGYSEGGFVAMATQRALQDLGRTVTATAPMSGPYALEAMGDAVITGSVNLGSTLFIPLLINSYQNAYSNVYSTLTEVYSASYASGIDSLLPGLPYAALVANGSLPQLALFSDVTPSTGDAALDAVLAIPANPLFASGFGDPYLIDNSVRIAYAVDAAINPDGFVPTPASGAPVAGASSYGLREDLRVNDMRYDDTFSPAAPTLLCGGSEDPSVYFLNAQAMQAFWASFSLPAGLLTVLDLETGLGAGDPYAAVEAGFAALKAQTAADAVAAGATDGGAAAVAEHYHGGLVPPFCTAAARGFFANF
ncbi:MAG: prolyl oligopeptidase family serine peptidase [Alphaproteobacteria bacterium]